jgi:hypothetical protein
MIDTHILNAYSLFGEDLERPMCDMTKVGKFHRLTKSAYW